jgi:nitrogen fixation protein FixH
MKTIFVFASVFALLVLTAACGSKPDGAAQTGKSIASVKVNDLTATISNNTGQLKSGEQEVTLAFADSAGKPVDVGAVSLNFHMPAMGSMAAMNNPVTFTTTTAGVYNGKVNIEMAGEWQGQLAYEGPAGKGKGTFSVTAR